MNVPKEKAAKKREDLLIPAANLSRGRVKGGEHATLRLRFYVRHKTGTGRYLAGLSLYPFQAFC